MLSGLASLGTASPTSSRDPSHSVGSRGPERSSTAVPPYIPSRTLPRKACWGFGRQVLRFPFCFPDLT